MTESSETPVAERLEPLIGTWSMEAVAPWAPTPPAHAQTVFEWMPGRRFVVQRWEIAIPEAPDGLAVYGFDEGRQTFLQHYFDSRGVARLYEMSLEAGVWKLWRESADFSPLDFSQRFTGRFTDDGTTIEGRWELCHDGSTWEHDFGLTYRRTGPGVTRVDRDPSS